MSCKQGQFQTSLGHVELRMRQSRVLGQAIKSNHNNDVLEHRFMFLVVALLADAEVSLNFIHLYRVVM